MARPKLEKTKQKTKIVSFRVTETEWNKLEEKADQLGYKINNFCRQASLKKEVKPKQSKLSGKIVAELKRQGKNLNGLAVFYNVNKERIEKAVEKEKFLRSYIEEQREFIRRFLQEQ